MKNLLLCILIAFTITVKAQDKGVMHFATGDTLTTIVYNQETDDIQYIDTQYTGLLTISINNISEQIIFNGKDKITVYNVSGEPTNEGNDTYHRTSIPVLDRNNNECNIIIFSCVAFTSITIQYDNIDSKWYITQLN